jgi:hypothetical protein
MHARLFAFLSVHMQNELLHLRSVESQMLLLPNRFMANSILGDRRCNRQV